MSQLSEDEKNRLFMTLDLHTKQNETLMRGMYGDEENKVKGLMDRTEHIEAWITRSKMKIAWLSGSMAVVVIGLKMAWEATLERIGRGGK